MMPCGDTSGAQRERGFWGGRAHVPGGRRLAVNNGLALGLAQGPLWWGCPQGCASLTAEKNLDWYHQSRSHLMRPR